MKSFGTAIQTASTLGSASSCAYGPALSNLVPCSELAGALKIARRDGGHLDLDSARWEDRFG
jgi:hypothetical protein